MGLRNKRSRGRPRREEADALRAQVWLLAVEKASGKRADALEAKFRALSDEKRTAGLWHKYARGEVTPKPALIDAVEQTYPGTAWWFHHPLWRLLRAEPITFAEVKESFFCLAAETRQFLVIEEKRGQFFWRVQEDVANTWKALMQLEQGMEVLCAFILLVQESEFRQDANQFKKLGLAAWVAIRDRLATEWPFCEMPDNQNSIFLAIFTILSDRWTLIIQANQDLLGAPGEESVPETP